jgi:hypothetical protein
VSFAAPPEVAAQSEIQLRPAANQARASGSPWVSTMLRGVACTRKLQQLLAVGVAAELEALDARLDLRFHVGGLEEERVAGLAGEQLPPGVSGSQ